MLLLLILATQSKLKANTQQQHPISLSDMSLALCGNTNYIQLWDAKISAQRAEIDYIACHAVLFKSDSHFSWQTWEIESA